MLKRFARDPQSLQLEAQADPRFQALEAADWMYENRSLDYMSSIAQGWLGSNTSGWRTPERFWRLCVHGSDWETKMRLTILSAQ